MTFFNLSTHIHHFNTFEGFIQAFHVNQDDIILTHACLYESYMASLNLTAQVLIQEHYGQGEPSDEMINAIIRAVKPLDAKRVIAIGGGSVLDIAKVLILKDIDDVVDAFERTRPLIKDKTLIAIPTTCGTGSEVTNITIAELKSKQTKMGLASPELMPDTAVLIPELLKGLPYSVFLYSSIDALIHASESFLSPKATPYTKLFSQRAIEDIIDIYLNIAKHGEQARYNHLEAMLIASNFAGIAFGNAGVGAVHALSYPLGGTYHVAHGEANYQFFTEVFKRYQKRDPNGAIAELNAIFARMLKTPLDKVYDALEGVLNQLIAKKPLKDYGMTRSDIQAFTSNVIEKQQRLLANNYVPFTSDDLYDIYATLYEGKGDDV